MTRERHQFYDSSWVASAFYDPASLTIEVVFLDGVHWNFFGCQKDTWLRFIRTGSAGKYVHGVLQRHPNRAA